MKAKSLFGGALAFTLLAVSVGLSAQKGMPSTPVQLGVYYYPGWTPDIPLSGRPDPWSPIRRFPKRLPAVGEYRDDDPSVLKRQMAQLRGAGFSFVVFDTYSLPGGAPRGDQAVAAYLKVAGRLDPKFAFLWANHDDQLSSNSDWDTMVSRWIDVYMRDPRYFRVNKKPLVFIFSPKNLEMRASTFGQTTRALLTRAETMARKVNIPGISFVAGGGPHREVIASWARSQGYDALSDYNMGTANYPMSGVGFARRAAVYKRYWEVYARDADLPVILPMTAGWDRSPWGGSAEDGAEPTPSELTAHIKAGLSIIRRNETPLSRLGIICCWNEYGEGSVIEPTVGDGNSRLLAIKTALDNH